MTTYSPIWRLPIMQPGDAAVRSSWGNILDAALPLIEQGAVGNAPIVLTGTTGAYNLTLANDASDQARLGFYNFQGIITVDTTVTIPPIARVGWVGNNTNAGGSLVGAPMNVILTTGNGTSLTIAPGFAYLWTCDGTNVSAVSIGTTGTITATNGVVLGNATFIDGKDTSGVPQHMLGFGADNWVTMFAQGFGWRILNGAGTTTLVSVDAGGSTSVNGSMIVGGALTAGASLTVGGLLTAGGSASVGGTLTAGNLTTSGSLTVTNHAALNGGLTVNGAVTSGPIGSTGSSSFTSLTTTSNIVCGNAMQAGAGYLCKQGSGGGFGGNLFNLFWNGSAAALFIDTSNIGFITTSSDARFKTVVAPMADGALDRIGLLEPLVYRWKNKGIFRNDGKDHEGLLAQSLLPIIPSAVEGDPDGDDPVSINTIPLIATLIKAVQELTARVVAMEAKC